MGRAPVAAMFGGLLGHFGGYRLADQKIFQLLRR
jgi:hypothetical protein